MTWSYTSDPANVPADAVRWHLGDTDAARPLANDEDIDFALAQHSDARLAAAMVAKALAARFERAAGISIAGLSIDMSARAEAMRDLANTLTQEASGTSAALQAPVLAPVVTGASMSAVAAGRADSDRIPLAVERDYPPDALDQLP